jgi:type VI secretion system secreted protein VgrG
MENTNFDTTIFGTSRRFEDWLHDPTNPLVYCLLTLDGKEFIRKNSYSVELSQKTNDHDTFTITVPDDALDTFQGYVMENSKKLLGKDLTITYWRFGKIRQTFTGIIGKIRNKKDEGGGYGDLHITGFAPSILLENGKDCQSFENKTLEQIIKEVTEEYPQEAKVAISSNYLNEYNRKPLPYTVQYKESDYQFIKRLAIRHGEFFYYNGEKLMFGNDVQPILRLGENIDLIDIEFEMRMESQDFKYISYNAQSGARIEKDSSSIKSEFKESPFQSIAVIASGKVFKKKPKMHFNHTGIQDWSQGQLAEAVRLEKERRENLMQVKGRSKDPELKIGGRAELSDINSKAMETYRIIEIKHIYEPGDYYNEFVGIPDLFNASPFIDTEAVPKGEEQPARVVDNNDPMGMGRIRVQFPWQEEKGQKTPWIRTTTIYAGAGRGDYKIPEIGDEILVGFESGNAEKPFMLGALYNGAEVSGYHTANNDLKVMHSRIGNRLIMNDETGDVTLESQKGQTIAIFYGDGNIDIKAPENINISAGKSINITAGENVNVNAGMNIFTSASLNYTQTVGVNYVSSVAGNASHFITGELREIIEGDVHSETKKERQETSGGKSVSQSEDHTEIHSQTQVHNNSAEKSKSH